jgi:hypothetical protein
MLQVHEFIKKKLVNYDSSELLEIVVRNNMLDEISGCHGR